MFGVDHPKPEQPEHPFISQSLAQENEKKTPT